MNGVLESKIENMVSAINVNRKIDLNKLTSKAKGLEYNPDRFPGVVYRVREPKLAMLIFNSGKVICTGARSRKDIRIAIERLTKKLGEARFKLQKKPTYKIQNIVASSSLGFKVNLDVLATECMNTEYEPEQFPGLVFRLEEPKTVMLVFSSGKIIITGAKDIDSVDEAAVRTREMVKSYDAIISDKF